MCLNKLRGILLIAVAVLATIFISLEQSADAAGPACSPLKGRVVLAGGSFDMGETEAYPEERPIRSVTVAPFAIDRTEVTNARFAAFVEDTGYTTDAEKAPDPAIYPDIDPEHLTPGSAVFVPPAISGSRSWWQFVEGASWRHPEGPGSSISDRMDHPVVHVSHADATAFSAWAGGSLPTEGQWEYAARGGLSGARYEWGDEAPHKGSAKANTWQGFFPVENTVQDGHFGTAPVGCYPANGYGLHDMTGNVWEWTSDVFDAGAPNSGLIKGGSYLCSDNFCRRFRPAARHLHERDFSTSHLGFRLVYRVTPEDMEEHGVAATSPSP